MFPKQESALKKLNITDPTVPGPSAFEGEINHPS